MVEAMGRQALAGLLGVHINLPAVFPPDAAAAIASGAPAPAGLSEQDDLYRAPESWARRAFPSLTYFHEAARGGHFAAWEEPRLFSDEVRAAFQSLR